MACLCWTSCFVTSSWKSCGLLPSRAQWASTYFTFQFIWTYTHGLWFMMNFTFIFRTFQVAASMNKETDFIPNYPNLPSKLICMLHNVTLHVWGLQCPIELIKSRKIEQIHIERNKSAVWINLLLALESQYLVFGGLPDYGIQPKYLY